MHTSKGLPVNAVFGFTNIFLKFVEDIQREEGGGVRIARYLMQLGKLLERHLSRLQS